MSRMDDLIRNSVDKAVSGVEPPEIDVEKISRNTISQKKKATKKLIAVGAAATVAVCATVGVGAAYNWNFNSMLESLFGKGVANIIENTTEMDIPVSAEDNSALDISVKGITGDDEYVMAMIEVVRNDGGVFDCSPYILSGAENLGEYLPEFYFNEYRLYSDDNTPLDSYEEYFKKKSTVLVPDENSTDNKLTLAITFEKPPASVTPTKIYLCDLVETKNEFGYSNTVGNVRNIHLDTVMEEKFDGIWNAELPINYAPCKTKTVNVGKTANISAYPHTTGFPELTTKPYTLDELSYSNLSISVSLSRELPDDYNMIDDAWYIFTQDMVEITLTDGTVINGLTSFSGQSHDVSTISSDGKTETFNCSFIIIEPIDSNEIASIKVGDLIIPIS